MPKQHPFTQMKNVQIICFVPLLNPLELISVQYKKTTGILHCKIHKSTPYDNVKNYMRGAMSSSNGENFSTFPILNLITMLFFFSFLWNSPDKTSGRINEEIWDLFFFLFYRFELYFIDRHVYFDFKSSKIEEGNNLWQIIVV